MKHLFLSLLSFCIILVSCDKNKETPASGQVTLDNKIYQSDTYYSYGFSFQLAKKVSTLDTPEPDMTVEYEVLSGKSTHTAYFAANTYNPSFGLYGEYNDASAASTAFDALTSFNTNSISWIDMGYPLAVNQIWIVRTGEGNYAKLMITGLTTDETSSPALAACTFKWVYQADGSATFTE